MVTGEREDEAALLADLRAGDERAFERLVDRYHPALVRVARQYVSTQEIAEDVAQEAWLGLLRGLVLMGLIIIGGELLNLHHEEWWGRSKMVPFGETVGDWLRAMVGEKGDPWAKLERLTGVKVKPK
jgi:hypothetical protein